MVFGERRDMLVEERGRRGQRVWRGDVDAVSMVLVLVLVGRVVQGRRRRHGRVAGRRGRRYRAVSRTCVDKSRRWRRHGDVHVGFVACRR